MDDQWIGCVHFISSSHIGYSGSQCSWYQQLRLTLHGLLNGIAIGGGYGEQNAPPVAWSKGLGASARLHQLPTAQAAAQPSISFSQPSMAVPKVEETCKE